MTQIFGNFTIQILDNEYVEKNFQCIWLLESGQTYAIKYKNVMYGIAT